jgi:DSF synthase
MSSLALVKQPTNFLPGETPTKQLKTHYDEKNKIGWFLMRGAPRPCFTLKLLSEINTYLDGVKYDMEKTNGEKYNYLVVGSDIDGVFNLGGDLDLFSEYIKNGDRESLLSYALKCIDILYRNIHHYDLDLTTISLIQGDALGGGFEAALSSNVIIAERGIKMGLPEVLFNLFPGMGAYSLLSRKIGPVAAERMILSGEIYSSEDLHEMGVIDILAEKGEGEVAVYQYIKSAKRADNSYKSMRKIKDICNPVSFQELTEIATVWADAALKLSPKNLRMMKRLVRHQNGRLENCQES